MFKLTSFSELLSIFYKLTSLYINNYLFHSTFAENVAVETA